MLSKRLQAIADMVSDNKIVADVGSDHGYIPIELIKTQKCPKAFAMDINKGPIDRAIENATLNKVDDKITFLLSDGMEKLNPNDCESVIIAGMGGDLILKILQESKINDTVDEFIVSPHTKQWLVREYFINNGFKIVNEQMLMDAGKYYQIIKAIRKTNDEVYQQTDLMYGKILLDKKDSTLKKYLEKELSKYKKIAENKNVREILEKITLIESALKRYN